MKIFYTTADALTLHYELPSRKQEVYSMLEAFMTHIEKEGVDEVRNICLQCHPKDTINIWGTQCSFRTSLRFCSYNIVPYDATAEIHQQLMDYFSLYTLLKKASLEGIINLNAESVLNEYENMIAFPQPYASYGGIKDLISCSYPSDGLELFLKDNPCEDKNSPLTYIYTLLKEGSAVNMVE